MKSIITGMAIAGLLVAGSAMAAEMPALAKKMNCTACHAIDKKIVGPAWQDVANKYKGDASAAEKLQVKVSKGGSGNWGTMPMPANDAAGTKQAEIKELVAFVLGLAK
ncbi:MAG: c-type cytochrome [Pseudomonadota bacterium]